MGRHRKADRRRVRPVAVTSFLAVGMAGAIAGATALTSQATAHSSGKHATVETAAVAPATPAAAPTLPVPSPSASPSASATPSAAPSASPAVSPSSTDAGLGTTAVVASNDESDRIGALFTGGVGAGNHFCTASVIHSSTKNLILTAAHCLASADGVTFVPGYRDGATPFGTWQATKLYTADGWQQNNDPDEDFAIIELAPLNGHNIEDLVGANELGTSAPFAADARLYGYPGTTEKPILCTNHTTQSDTYQRRIDCPSFPGGTSGGPFIDTADNKVIGVIGGYQQGGDSDDTSYSAYFDHTIADLYQKAVSGSS